MRILAIASVATLATLSFVACSSAGPGASATTQAWNASSATDETKSTHLWVVNRAIDIIANHTTDIPAVANTLAWMRDDAQCRTNWQNGLFYADYLAPFNAGSGDLAPENVDVSQQGCCCGVDLSSIQNDISVLQANSTWLIHFFDPDTARDYGNFAISSDMPDNSLLHPIYSSIRSVLESGGMAVPVEARGAAIYRLGNASTLLAGTDVRADHSSEPSDLRDRGCYELGLAVHYLTDITQPMHASNFAATDLPRLLHSHFEDYAQSIQASNVVSDWQQTPAGGDLMTVIQQIAVKSKAHWYAAGGSPGPLKLAFQDAYASGCAWDANGNVVSSTTCAAAAVEANGSLDNVSLDLTSCWQNNLSVAAETGNALKDAQLSTAQFLAAIQLPAYVPNGAASSDGTPESWSTDDAGGAGGDWGADGGEDGGEDAGEDSGATAQVHGVRSSRR